MSTEWRSHALTEPESRRASAVARARAATRVTRARARTQSPSAGACARADTWRYHANTAARQGVTLEGSPDWWNCWKAESRRLHFGAYVRIERNVCERTIWRCVCVSIVGARCRWGVDASERARARARLLNYCARENEHAYMLSVRQRFTVFQCTHTHVIIALDIIYIYGTCPGDNVGVSVLVGFVCWLWPLMQLFLVEMLI